MSKVTLTRVFRKEVDTKYGIKPNISIQTEEHGDKWLSTFKVTGTTDWEEGQQVEINVQENGDFLNFIPVSKSSGTKESNNDIELRVAKLEKSMEELKKGVDITAFEDDKEPVTE